MNVYCDLIINSKTSGVLPENLFKKRGLSRFEFTDNESAERKLQRERWRSAGIPIRKSLERYWWELSSQGRVPSDDLTLHLIWILGHLRKGRLLSDLDAKTYSYHLSVFWGESNGTGGGPLLKPELAELLVAHRAKMAIGFYVQ